MSNTVCFEQSNGIARLTLNRPERHNALGHEELAGIESAISNLHRDTRVLVIGSEGGRTFCAGADLAQITRGELSGDQFQAVTNQIADLPIPTICLLNGNVFGGGVELAVSCDFRIAADDIVMRVPAAAIGLCYPLDGIKRLISRLGLDTAKRILVGAEEFSSQEMKSLGVVGWLAPPSDIQRCAMEIAQQLAGHAPLAVRSMLKIMKQAEVGSIDPAGAAQLVEMCASSSDLQEGLTAKRERRRPEFKGN